MVIHTKRKLRLVYANICCDFTRQVSIHSFSAVRPRSWNAPQKRMAARNKTSTAYFLPSCHWRTPRASFAPAKPEADGIKIKPARLFLSRRPFASLTRQFCPRKTGSGRPKNKTCTVIFIPSCHWRPSPASFAPQSWKRTAEKLHLYGYFVPSCHWRPPLASFAPAKLEADGRKIKPIRLFYPVRPAPVLLQFSVEGFPLDA